MSHFEFEPPSRWETVSKMSDDGKMNEYNIIPPIDAMAHRTSVRFIGTDVFVSRTENTVLVYQVNDDGDYVLRGKVELDP